MRISWSWRAVMCPLALGFGALGLLVSGCDAPSSLTRGVDGVDVSSSRIVGGDLFDGLPAVGALTYNGQAHCTGTLIGPRKVLTAGHCVTGVSASRMRFVIGPSISNAQAVLTVARLEAHPSYSGLNNDIALVHLTSDAPVAPMAVLPAMDSTFVGKSLFFVGYGVDDGRTNSGVGIKRAVTIPIASISATTFRYTGSRNTCGGDSGGPAFYQGDDGTLLVAGVTSYGDQFCLSYGVDTRVDVYASFLDVSTTSPPVDPCGGETFEGRCDDQTVVWCESSRVNRQDCATSGRVCQFDPGRAYYGCVTPTDPCQGETFVGRCADQTVIWCENQTVQRVDCTSRNRSCGFSQSAGYYGCI